MDRQRDATGLGLVYATIEPTVVRVWSVLPIGKHGCASQSRGRSSAAGYTEYFLLVEIHYHGEYLSTAGAVVCGA